MIGYAARTVSGFWSFLAVLVLLGVNIWQRGADWYGDPLLVADAQGIPQLIIGPLLTAVAAVDAARLTSAGRRHLVSVAPSWRHPYVFAVLATWLPVAISQILVGIGCLLVYAPESLLSRTGADVAIALAVLTMVSLASVSVGSFVGRFLGTVVAGLVGVLLGVLTVFVTVARSGAGAFGAFDVGGATVSRIGFAYDTGYLAWQGVVVACVSAALVLGPVVVVRARVLPSLRAVGAVTVAVWLVVAPPAFLPGQRMTFDPAAPSDCSGEPEICMYSESAHVREAYSSVIRGLIDEAASAGYAALVPDRVEQVSVTYGPQRTGRTHVVTFTVHGAEPVLVDLVVGMVTPVQCPQLSADEPPGEEFWTDVARVSATWLTLAGTSPDDAGAVFGLEGFTPLSPADVSDLTTAFRSCDLR